MSETEVLLLDGSPQCRRGSHEGCDGTLRTKTGLHWWCACLCHPDEPKPIRVTSAAREALGVWRNARAVLSERTSG